jgi:uncharacterized protein (DUF1330 family)
VTLWEFSSKKQLKNFYNSEKYTPSQEEYNMLCSSWEGVTSYLEKKMHIGCEE